MSDARRPEAALAEIYDLEGALASGLGPADDDAPEGRGRAVGGVSDALGLVHERFISDEVGRLLDELAPLEDELDYDSDDASLIRVTRRDWEKARRVPAELAAAWAREGARRMSPGWRRARRTTSRSSCRRSSASTTSRSAGPS